MSSNLLRFFSEVANDADKLKRFRSSTEVGRQMMEEYGLTEEQKLVIRETSAQAVMHEVEKELISQFGPLFRTMDC